MWSMQRRSGFPTLATNRMINLVSFDRLDRLQDLAIADYLANTLALVEPLQTAAPHIAVISGWSAIESLLVGPADAEDIVAARRFSLIIAASLMRAEFTWLAKTYIAENSDAEAQALDDCASNIERAKLFQMLAFTRPALTLTNVTDNLALQRVRPALQNPRREITNIAEILTREFTRLYRKRNMVVHGGQIRGANLHSISETLTPLIGAGIDRIVNAELQFGVSAYRTVGDSRSPGRLSHSHHIRFRRRPARSLGTPSSLAYGPVTSTRHPATEPDSEKSTWHRSSFGRRLSSKRTATHGRSIHPARSPTTLNWITPRTFDRQRWGFRQPARGGIRWDRIWRVGSSFAMFVISGQGPAGRTRSRSPRR